jgi:hypothetical protein
MSLIMLILALMALEAAEKSAENKRGEGRK